MRKDKDGNPLYEDCLKRSFGSYYFNMEPQTLFRALYENLGGLQDKYIMYQNVVQSRFFNNTNVIGYDPLNEPSIAFNSPFDLFKEIGLGRLDKDRVAPLYKRVFQEV